MKCCLFLQVSDRGWLVPQEPCFPCVQELAALTLCTDFINAIWKQHKWQLLQTHFVSPNFCRPCKSPWYSKPSTLAYFMKWTTGINSVSKSRLAHSQEATKMRWGFLNSLPAAYISWVYKAQNFSEFCLLFYWILSELFQSPISSFSHFPNQTGEHLILGIPSPCLCQTNNPYWNYLLFFFPIANRLLFFSNWIQMYESNISFCWETCFSKCITLFHSVLVLWFSLFIS